MEFKDVIFHRFKETIGSPNSSNELLVRCRVLLDVGVDGLVGQGGVGGADDVRARSLAESAEFANLMHENFFVH